MARPSSADPIEKFRFEVTFLAGPSIFSQLNSLTGATAEQNSTGNTSFAIGESPGSNPASGANEKFSRAGFSEVTIPKATITEINYRENTNAPMFAKIPGMIRYENLVLRRGVTDNKEMYAWFKTTNNVVLGISALAQGLSAFAVIPTQAADYRVDLVLSAKNRLGNYVKHWFFYNCFISSYKPGDDFNSVSDAKLIEEASVAFEQMIESNKDTIQEAIEDIDEQVKQATLNAVAISLL